MGAISSRFCAIAIQLDELSCFFFSPLRYVPDFFVGLDHHLERAFYDYYYECARGSSRDHFR